MPRPSRKHPLRRFTLTRRNALKRHACHFFDSILTCYSSKKPETYDDAALASSASVVDQEFMPETLTPSLCHNPDLVSLKISLLGDSQIGKTTFLVRRFLFCYGWSFFLLSLFVYLIKFIVNFEGQICWE